MICDHYTWSTVPPHHKTAKQWLKLHRRLKKSAQPVGTITMIFDKPREKPRYVEPVPPEECQQIRDKLKEHGLDSFHTHDLCRLDRAGQLAVCNLYDQGDTDALSEKALRCVVGPQAA